jgi:uncharacterized membrane protein
MRFRKSVLAIFGLSVGALASALHANPTQEDVFKSISENMSEKSDSGPFLAVLAIIAAVAILVAIVSKRRERVAAPKVLNHQKKLLKEVLRSTPLKPAEARLLKTLGESQDVDNALVMLLCPSVLEKALRQKNTKLDRKVAIQLARKAGLIPVRSK